ncbi:unnamed protein product [Rangifer tarandus platyrhynchus]|uniref:Uncharacterized protein n=3 Tax=Rangifer tarandus platyrhynchus TaxID=3082113 RepID=A0AC59YN00_RANTA|nr:unnamed protein product [Rangifer tarandus platyrhynchus]CAI9699843.1 unnamed protein product [Rangifer tarandus platyrhynchus]
MRLISGYTFDLEADLHCFIIAAVVVTDSEPVPLTVGGSRAPLSKHQGALVSRSCALRQTACAGAGQSRGRGCWCHECGLGEAALSLHMATAAVRSRAPRGLLSLVPRLPAQHRSGPPQHLRFKET